MKKSLSLIGMELRYLLRQIFLWILIIVGIAFAIWQLPSAHEKIWDYAVFDEYNRTHSIEGMSDQEKAHVEYLSGLRERTKYKRKALYERAVEEKESLKRQEGYEWEYLTAIEKAYGEEITLEIQDYTGWDIFFLYHTDMQPVNPLDFLLVISTVSGGLLLLTKDRERNTRFWSALTGRGGVFPSFFCKLAAAFLYGLCFQLLFKGFTISLLALVNHFDMRHWLHLIQNTSQFGICDLQISILGLCILDSFLKCILSLMVLLFVFMAAPLVKRYIFLFLGGVTISGVLYYFLFLTCRDKYYSDTWRLNPFSIFKLDKFLAYDVVNIMDHAVDMRVLIACLWTVMLAFLSLFAYKIWRRYLYAG